LGLSLIWFLIIGIVAGFIAGKLTKGSGFGVVGDLAVGVLGSLVGGFLFNLLGIAAYSLIGQLIMAVVGAVILLWLIGTIRRRG